MNGPDKSKRSELLLWGMVAAYIVAFFSFCWLRFISFGYYDWDLAVYSQIIFNVSRGDLFNSLLGVNFLGHHAHFLAFPLALIYKAWPHPVTLLFLQTAALGGAAVPLFYLARIFLSPRWALLTCFLYLFHVGTAYSIIYEFHFTSFAPLIFFCIFYFYFTLRYVHYLVSTVLALLCQENFALSVFMFGLLALVQRRSARWWLPLLAGSIVYLLFCVKVLLPGLNPGTIQFISIYRHWGSDYGEIILNLASHPMGVLRYIFMPHKLEWLWTIFSSLSLVPFLSPGYLSLALPFFLQRLLSNRAQETMISFHYLAEILPIIFLAFIFGLRRILAMPFMHNRRKFLGLLLPAMMIPYFLLFPLKDIFFGNIYRTRFSSTERVKEQWVERVPAKASVVASFEFLSHLANRKDLFSFQYIYSGQYILSSKRYQLDKLVDMALIDFNDPFLIESFYFRDGYKNTLDFLQYQKLSVEDVVNSMVFFRRGGDDKKVLYKVWNEAPAVPFPVNVRFDNSLKLIGYDLKASGKDRLEVVFYWQVLKKPDYDMHAVFLFERHNSDEFRKVLSPSCYRILPTYAWEEGTWIEEHKYILIPDEIKGSDFSFSTGFAKEFLVESLPFFKLSDFRRVDHVN